MKPYYQDDRVTIYHGDSRDIVPDLPKVELLLTDPPYSPGRDQGECRASGNIAVALHLASEKAQRALVFSGSSNRSMEFVRSSIRRLQHNRILCWHNGGSRSNSVGPWQWDLVLVHYFGKAFAREGDMPSALTQSDKADAVECKATGHRAAVPIHVMQHFYGPFAPCSVLDPFCGSGASLLAVKALGGTAIGVEIDEKHCELAARRVAEVPTPNPGVLPPAAPAGREQRVVGGPND